MRVERMTLLHRAASIPHDVRDARARDSFCTIDESGELFLRVGDRDSLGDGIPSLGAVSEDESAVPSSPAKLRLGFGAVVVLVIGALSVTVGVGLLRGQTAPVESVPVSEIGVAAPLAEVYVHVLGAVTHPGLYVLDADARVVDALAAAGGTLDGADLRAVNLARLLTDGEQLFVPLAGESDVGTDSPGIAVDGRIDINTADQAQLETLPRIGPALAQRIIQWRETNGRFRSVDDLLAVPGIGEKLLAGIRDGVRA